MAKITIFDCCRFKFMQDLMEHWQSKGHEIKKTLYADPKMIDWADVVFFDWLDNSILRAANPEDSLWAEIPQPKNKNIVVRCHDIDAWVGYYKRVTWDWINHLVFPGLHIKDMVCKNSQIPDSVKIHHIKHGLNLEKFPMRKNPEKGKKIAWMGRITHHKCLELALQVLAENPEYELYAIGSSLDSWEEAYVYDFVKRNNLKFFHTPEIPHDEVSTFLEDKNYILLTSFKEAFSFAIAEGMARGLKPLIHWFYGAETVWDKKYLWTKVSEVKPMLEGDYNPQEYRDYIDKNFNFREYLDNYDKITGL